MLKAMWLMPLSLGHQTTSNLVRKDKIDYRRQNRTRDITDFLAYCWAELGEEEESGDNEIPAEEDDKSGEENWDDVTQQMYPTEVGSQWGGNKSGGAGNFKFQFCRYQGGEECD